LEEERMPLDAQTQAVLEMMVAMGGEAEPVGKTEDREIVPKNRAFYCTRHILCLIYTASREG
jgi:hypothetical protein